MGPSRARSGTPRTLRRAELETRLDRTASVRADAALNELRDAAREIAPALGMERELEELDGLARATTTHDLCGGRSTALSGGRGA